MWRGRPYTFLCALSAIPAAFVLNTGLTGVGQVPHSFLGGPQAFARAVAKELITGERRLRRDAISLHTDLLYAIRPPREDFIFLDEGGRLTLWDSVSTRSPKS